MTSILQRTLAFSLMSVGLAVPARASAQQDRPVSNVSSPSKPDAPNADSPAWNPRSGDAWVDAQLGDMNIYAARYRGAFTDELVRYHAAPREFATALLVERHWSPGDVYYACAIAQTIGQPCRVVADAWEREHDHGWADVAAGVGLNHDADTRLRLRQDITASFERWARPLSVALDTTTSASRRGKPSAAHPANARDARHAKSR